MRVVIADDSQLLREGIASFVRGEGIEVAAASAGHDHAARSVAQRRWNAPADHVGGHQPRDLKTDLANFPREGRSGGSGRDAFEHLLKAQLREPPRQEDDVFHASFRSDRR